MKFKVLLFVWLIVISFNSFSQWSSNDTINTPVCIQPNTQNNPYIVTDGKKGAIIAWNDTRSDTAQADIYAQRMNAAGYPMWTANGVGICVDTFKQKAVKLIDAGNGSAIITWQDARNGDYDIYAQKIDSSGNVLWATNGVPVCIKPFNQINPEIANDMHGGAIIVWEDSSATSGWDIYSQRLDSTGTQLWGPTGFSVCSQLYDQKSPKMRADGYGGAVVSWQDKRSVSINFVYAQRLLSFGDIQWTTDGVQVCGLAGGQTNAKIGAQPDGGAIVAWEDKRNGNYDLFAQKLDATSGAQLWGPNGATVCFYPGNQSAIDLTTDNVNGAIISWKDDRNGPLEIYANRLDESGIIVWPGIASSGVFMGNGINSNIVGDNNGGAIITWQDSLTSGGSFDVYAQRVDSTGTKLWGTSNKGVSLASGGQSDPKHVGTGDGGAIFCWWDKRNGIDHDIYAHHLFPEGHEIFHMGVDEINGNSGGVVCYPNPFSTQSIIKLNSSKPTHLWSLNVYDVNGRRVISESNITENKIVINRNELNEGIYFYQAITNSEIIGEGKFVIINN